MGASSSCAIFERFSTALQWICNKHLNIPHVLHILDDFLFMGQSFEECQTYLTKFLTLCQELGVPIKQEKQLLLPKTLSSWVLS